MILLAEERRVVIVPTKRKNTSVRLVVAGESRVEQMENCLLRICASMCFPAGSFFEVLFFVVLWVNLWSLLSKSATLVVT